MRQPFKQPAGQQSDYAEATSSKSCTYQATSARCGINRCSALCVLCRYRHKTHWTAHPTRLARDLANRFGSSAYAREELIAELTSAFLCAHLNIAPQVRHADYLGHWLAILKEDARAIFHAASQASKASDFLLAFQQPQHSEIPPREAVEQEP